MKRFRNFWRGPHRSRNLKEDGMRGLAGLMSAALLLSTSWEGNHSARDHTGALTEKFAHWLHGAVHGPAL